jgi:hypothetical protein
VADSSQFDEMLQERSAKLNEASHIVAVASTEGRELTPDEDSQVLLLVKQVQNLDEGMNRLRKHPDESGTWRRQRDDLV